MSSNQFEESAKFDQESIVSFAMEMRAQVSEFNVSLRSPVAQIIIS
jgi:hypothetical protein